MDNASNSNNDNNNCWDAFGNDSFSSSDDEDNTNDNTTKVEELKLKKILPAIDSASLYLVKLWSPSNRDNCHNIPLTKRCISYLCSDAFSATYISSRWNQQRGFIVQSIKEGDMIDSNWNNNVMANIKNTSNKNDSIAIFDAAILVIEDFDDNWETKIKMLQDSVVPGGYFILFLISSEIESSIEMYGFSYNVWDIDNKKQQHSIVYEKEEEMLVYCIKKRPCLLNLLSCTWKYSSNNTTSCLKHEYDVLSNVTITSPATEYNNPTYALSPQSINKAICALQTHGFCIIKNIFPKDIVQSFGQAAINDMKEAISVLKRDHNVDILDPIASNQSYISNFRELAMREDLRVDLRDGKGLRQVIKTYGEDWIKKHESVLNILTKVMNPRDEEKQLHQGNFGKWNFENVGPDGPPDPPRSGPIGTILTFPKCGDQAIHADTSHLFDVIECHPPHYINLFLPITPLSASSNGSNPMGGTAFISKSHVLSTCKYYLEQKKQMHKNVIRPSLDIGDAILFDCRVLHFGMANNSHVDSSKHSASKIDDSGWRPMLYVNWMLKWFTDPKNWQNEKSLFADLDD